jgi:transposase
MCRRAETGSSIVPKPTQISGPKITSETGESGGDPAVSGARLESVSGRRHRRVFTAAEKLRILQAADAALASGERGALQALLRKRGIYSSLLSSWRVQLAAQGTAGLAARRPGRKAKLTEAERRMTALTKRNEVLERQLHIATVLIELQKKAHAILDIALPESEGGS